jgi:Zn-dependent protease
MDSGQASLIVNGLIYYIGLVILLTFHEYAHAWTSHKCGDDTARLQGRLSLNPVAHIDPVGTVLFPLLMIFLPALSGNAGTFTRFMIGWAKPVPVNIANLRSPHRDDCLIAMAGPAMNFILAVLLVGMARVAFAFGSDEFVTVLFNMAQLSLVLCFFNLIPIPPLDGSHVARNFIGMSWETYWRLCQPPASFIFVIVAINIPGVRNALGWAVGNTLTLLAMSFHFPDWFIGAL